VNTIKKFVTWTIRERELLKNQKEVNYIKRILGSYSLENVFLASKLEDHGSIAEDYKLLLEGHLQSISKSKLGIKYEPLTPYQNLVGKRHLSPEEEKRAIIIRIKKHLSESFIRSINPGIFLPHSIPGFALLYSWDRASRFLQFSSKSLKF
jgi:hypothetical protein